eukprot:gnl/TRDRNA2_/TRDRNA2_132352_c0_seq2.p1 gnl/TRDRNA2_/TRDRNA2_132352_c0~~gnl/TRDRNA2_/TRDRNA2_132352_c0_seq2.p1  ORF type:complete len:863 (-),score=118.46 gnl/TRDRNA2_/TRDRNA2_132352_c0_seq2:92-2680(-)
MASEVPSGPSARDATPQVATSSAVRRLSFSSTPHTASEGIPEGRGTRRLSFSSTPHTASEGIPEGRGTRRLSFSSTPHTASNRSRESTHKADRAARPPAEKTILDENQRLRQENQRLRQDTERSEARALRAELLELRRRNAELEEQAQAVQSKTRENDKEIREPSALERRLQTRRIGRDFDLKGFEMRRSGEDVGEVQGSPPLQDSVASSSVGPEASRETSTQETALVLASSREDTSFSEPLASQDSFVAGMESLADLPWLAQHSLSGAGREASQAQREAKDRFSEVLRQLQAGATEAAADALRGLLERHLQDPDRPHLSFSASLLSLFSLLRSAAGTSPADADSEAAAKIVCPYSQCATLIRYIIEHARFHGEPPQRRPEDLSRQRFVRELAVQVGLSLDLVRLALSQRNESRRKAKPEQTPPRRPARGSKRERSAQSIERSECETMLERAGLYLAAVQMHMDRLRDDTEQQMKERREQQALAAMQEVLSDEGKPSMDSDRPENDEGKPSMDSDRPENVLLPLNNADSDDTSRVIVTPSAPLGAAAWSESLAAKDRDSAPSTSAPARQPSASAPRPRAVSFSVDTLLTPTFGEFVELQLLPLYIADVSFSKLRSITEDHSGMPLNSDDEEKAWKVVGVHSPKTRRGQRSSRGRQSPDAPSRRVRRRVVGEEESVRPSGAPKGPDTAAGSADALMPPPPLMPMSQVRAAMASKEKTSDPTPRGQMAASVFPAGTFNPKQPATTYITTQDGKKRLVNTTDMQDLVVRRASRGVATPAKYRAIAETPSASVSAALFQSPAPMHVRPSPGTLLRNPQPQTPRTCTPLVGRSTGPANRQSAPAWELMGETPSSAVKQKPRQDRVDT